jgi:hypothetical protein
MGLGDSDAEVTSPLPLRRGLRGPCGDFGRKTLDLPVGLVQPESRVVHAFILDERLMVESLDPAAISQQPGSFQPEPEVLSLVEHRVEPEPGDPESVIADKLPRRAGEPLWPTARVSGLAWPEPFAGHTASCFDVVLNAAAHR